MDIQISLDTRRPYRAATEVTSEISAFEFAYRAGATIRIQFVRDGAAVRLEEGSQVVFVTKPWKKFLALPRAFSNAFTRPEADDGWYQAIVPFTADLIGDDLNGESPDPDATMDASADYMSAIIWIRPGELQESTPPIPTTIYNSLYETGDPLPLGVGISASFPLFVAAITGPSGGTPADLDSIPTAGGAFPLGGIVQFVDSDRGLVSYQLREAEPGAAPACVTPTDYDAEAPLTWWSV